MRAWPCLGLLLALAGSARGDPATVVVATVVEQAVAERTFKASATGFGKVQSAPAKVISIDAPHDGTLLRVLVRAGQQVANGAPLVELSLAPAIQERFRKAQTAFDFAKTKQQSEQYLWSKGATTRDQLDQAQSAFRDAQAALEALRRQGAQQQQQTLNAPVSGTVTAVAVSEGDQVTQNAKLVTMTPSNALAVLLGVEPEDVRKVRLGMEVTLNPAFDPEKHYSGQVSALNNVVDPTTRLVDVLVEVKDAGADAPLIGTKMRGDIALQEVRGLGVPTQALLYDKDGTYIFLDKGGQAARVPVTPITEGSGFVAVQGAVKEGDQVVVQGNYELNDGMKIEQATRGVH